MFLPLRTGCLRVIVFGEVFIVLVNIPCFNTEMYAFIHWLCVCVCACVRVCVCTMYTNISAIM